MVSTIEDLWVESIHCSFNESGIFVTRFTEEMYFSMKHSRLMNNYLKENTNKPLPNLVIACPGVASDPEILSKAAKKEAHRYISARAIVCDTLSHRILGNFFIKIQKPPVPTKMFSTEEQALLWLEQFID